MSGSHGKKRGIGWMTEISLSDLRRHTSLKGNNNSLGNNMIKDMYLQVLMNEHH